MEYHIEKIIRYATRRPERRETHAGTHFSGRFFRFGGQGMEARQTTFQTPRPEVKIYSSDGALKLKFDTSNKKVLQAYSFGASVNDARGHFSLTFHPDEADYSNPIFDQIEELDIVEIYESRNHFKQYRIDMGRTLERQVLPTFTGIVRKKKYASQIGENSVTRRLVVSGNSIAGLISEFSMSMDLTAQVITEEMASQENVSKSLTISLITKNEPLKVKEIIKTIWEEFLKLSTRYGKLSNPLIAEILKDQMGDDLFDIDGELTFQYPLGCVFNGKNATSFWDIVEGIIPSPVYERFAYMDRTTGKIKIKIRECPFDPESWESLKYVNQKKKDRILDCYDIPARLVKSMDIEQSDDEVYTVYFSYLDGYPLQMERAIILQKQDQESKSMPALVVNDEKYAKYGYRPLFVHFIGYGKSEKEDDTTTEENLQSLNKKLMDWYGNLEKMYNGSLILSTDLSMDMPQAGEKIAFLGGEFYVVDSEHSWNYGENPQTTLSISRGGIYIQSVDKHVEMIESSDPLRHYTVKDRDTFPKISFEMYGTESKAGFIVSANYSMLKDRPEVSGYPVIYGTAWSPLGHPDILNIPPDPDKTKIKQKKVSSSKLEFEELKYWGKKKTESGVTWESLI
jgi:hypothetical protein